MLKFNDLLDNSKDIPSPKQNIPNQHIPWVDKYRPSKLAEVVYQDDVVKILKATLVTGNMPHLLFHGPPGTGKTSSILAVATELFGPRKYKERVVELNASDERGIGTVRNRIGIIAKMSISGRDPNYLCPDYKIIILDEADAMTTEAQSALRKIIEDNSEITRFCFICNYINQIIDPVASRCVKFRFKPIDESHMVTKLRDIAILENMQITDQAIKTISYVSNGDMRKGIMLLQNLNYLDKKFDVDDVYFISNLVPEKKLEEIIDVCITYDGNSTLKIRNLANELNSSGYPISVLLTQLVEHIVKNKIIDDQVKSLICLHVSNVEKRLVDGANEYLQLLSVFMCIKNYKKLIY